MSQGELTRFDILQRVERGELRVSDAAASLSLCPRQIYRLRDRLRADGAAGLVSRRHGRASNRRLNDAFRDHVVDIVREHDADFGPTLASEYLAEQHGITLSRETLRQMLIAAGVWNAKVAKRAASSSRATGASAAASWCRSTVRTMTGSTGGLRTFAHVLHRFPFAAPLRRGAASVLESVHVSLTACRPVLVAMIR